MTGEPVTMEILDAMVDATAERLDGQDGKLTTILEMLQNMAGGQPPTPPPPKQPETTSPQDRIRARLLGKPGEGAKPTVTPPPPAAATPPVPPPSAPPRGPGLMGSRTPQAPAPAARPTAPRPAALPSIGDKELQVAAVFQRGISTYVTESTDFKKRRSENYDALIQELASRRLRIDQEAEYANQAHDYIRPAISWLPLQMTWENWTAKQAVDYAVEQGWTYELTYSPEIYRAMMERLHLENIWVRKYVTLDDGTQLEVLAGIATLIDTGQLDIENLANYVRDNGLVGRRRYDDDDNAVDKEHGEAQYPMPTRRVRVRKSKKA